MALSRQQAWTIFAAAWATSSVAAGFAFVGPVLALLLERMTGSGSFIGLFASVSALTTVMLTPLAPRLMSRFPSGGIVAAGLLGAAACFPLFKLLADPWLWFPVRFVQGLCLTVVFVVCETWINSVTPEEVRGRVLSLYAIALAGGLGLGAAAAALLIDRLGLDGWLPFLIGMAIVGAGFVPLALRRHITMSAPEAHDSSIAVMLGILKGAPGLFAAVFAFGAIEFSLFHMVPVYGVRLGFSEGAAAMLLLAMPVGSLLLTYPIGMAADRFDRGRVLLLLFGTCVALALLISRLSGFWPITVALAVFVGAAGGLYTVGLAILSERHKGARMAAANSSFIMLYGVGSLLSPFLIGEGMDRAGPEALPLMLAGVTALAMGVYVLTRRPLAVAVDT